MPVGNSQDDLVFEAKKGKAIQKDLDSNEQSYILPVVGYLSSIFEGNDSFPVCK